MKSVSRVSIGRCETRMSIARLTNLWGMFVGVLRVHRRLEQVVLKGPRWRVGFSWPAEARAGM